MGYVLLIGSLVSLINFSGGVNGFIYLINTQKQLVNSKRDSLLLAYILGLVIFIESSITSLIAGNVARPLSDKYKASRASLAYVCDSTSAPVCSIIMFNAWGALMLGLISTQISYHNLQDSAIEILLQSIMFNFYAFISLIVVFVYIWFGLDIGPMKNAKILNDTENISFKKSKPSYMVFPIVLSVVLMFVFLYISGDGNIFKGSGSFSLFYSLLSSVIISIFYYKIDAKISLKSSLLNSVKSMKNMLNLAILLFLAIYLGDISSKLHIATYLASISQNILNPIFLPAILFLLSAIIAFSTGTSFGTFSIMTPIAFSLAISFDMSIALCVGAIISGGVFGDHSSPISDTTIISSIAAKCELIEHIKTQLPYALIAAFLSLILFILFANII